MMKTIYKKYVPCNSCNGNVNNLRVELFYDIGGNNFYTGRPETRGYYLSVTPVYFVQNNRYSTEQVTAFSGIKVLLKETNRQSKKAENIAMLIAETQEAFYIDYICRHNSIILTEEKGA